jgi:hypothetical protein
MIKPTRFDNTRLDVTTRVQTKARRCVSCGRTYQDATPDVAPAMCVTCVHAEATYSDEEFNQDDYNWNEQ